MLPFERRRPRDEDYYDDSMRRTTTPRDNDVESALEPQTSAAVRLRTLEDAL